MKKNKIRNLILFSGSGSTPSRKEDAYWNSRDIPWLKTDQIGDYKIYDTNEYVSKKAFDECSLKIYPAGAISMAMYGEGKTRGSVSIIASPMTTNQACFTFVVDEEKINSKYVYYFLLNQYNNLRQLSSGVRKNLNADIIKNVEISYPKSRCQQDAIANVLGSIDDKILANRKIITTLESMAKTLYDYWFVQFDFPDANGRPYKTSGGKMEWNETLSREIPVGWEVKKLSSLCELKNGINYDKSVKGDKLYRIVNVRNITATSLLVDEQDLDEIKLLSKQAEKYLVGDNDILIARSGNPGAVRLLTNNHNVIYCGFIICCQVLSEMLKLYLTFTLKKYEGTNLTKTGGSIMQNVSQDTLNSIDVIVPPQDIIQVYNEKVISMVEKIKILVEETNKLANLRDFLLPMLMNGQVTFRQ